MNKIRLGINIDHVATVRNARGGVHPCPIKAAKIAKEAGADGITAHLREDRRHIKDQDIKRLKSEISLPLNLEMAATDEMLQIALEVKPNACCIVPEKREELTTEGGLNVSAGLEHLTPFVSKLKSAGIRVSLFIDPDEQQVLAAKQLGTDIIELHTGNYCESVENDDKSEEEFAKIVNAAKIANNLGIECHAGHGLCYNTVGAIASIENMVELNIGHFIIGESIFVGLPQVIKRTREIIDKNTKCEVA